MLLRVERWSFPCDDYRIKGKKRNRENFSPLKEPMGLSDGLMDLF